MDLTLRETGFYESGSQSARAWTESWVRASVYRPACGAGRLSSFPANAPVADFLCPMCAEQFELKSQKTPFRRKVADGAYKTMCERLASSENPNLFLLNYDRLNRRVTNVAVVPKQFFVRDMIEERKPLGPTARRAGWVGCNILLDQVPASARIFLVRDSAVRPKEAVLEDWRRLLFLRDEGEEARGWLMEVMRCVESLGRREFALHDVYRFEEHLSEVYPNNRHIREKIRQQLQVLRDHGYLEFVSRGSYRLSRPA